jgi:uncharacterized glyoxalase superfamily protein PhnB
MEQRLSLITLGTENVPALTSFYEETFGWKPLPNSNEEVTFFQLNGFQLGIFGKQALAEDAQISSAGSGFKGFSLSYNLQSQKEVDELFKELKAKNVKVLKEPQKVFWGGYSGYIADLDGNIWEIAHNPYMEFDEDGNVISPSE